MSKKVLRLDSSIFAEGGESSQLNDYFIEQMKKVDPDIEVVHRALNPNTFPHFSGDLMSALVDSSKEPTEIQKEKVAFADELIAELKEADVLLVAAPMYNFGIPSALKSWMDHVARAGTTFKYTESGPVGLLENTSAVVVTTRGGQYKDTPLDSHTPHLETFLRFIGIDDIKVIFAEGLNMGQKEQSIAKAKQDIELLLSH